MTGPATLSIPLLWEDQQDGQSDEKCAFAHAGKMGGLEW